MPAPRIYPTPIMKTLWPFAVGAGLTYLGFRAIAKTMAQADEFKHDRRNHWISGHH